MPGDQKLHHWDPPHLPTFDQLPSWVNARGFIDRSACVEVRVSEIRKLAGCVPSSWFQQMTGRTDARWKADQRLPLPHEVRAHNGRGRLVTGVYTIRAREVSWLHERRTPRQLAGDWRSARANVMREGKVESGKLKIETESSLPLPRGEGGGGLVPPLPLIRKGEGGGEGAFIPPPSEGGGQGEGEVIAPTCAHKIATHPKTPKLKPTIPLRIIYNGPAAWGFDAKLEANPNKGACRSKQIGLHQSWSQPLRIEKWEFKGRIHPAYYLVCPGCWIGKNPRSHVEDPPGREPSAMSHKGKVLTPSPLRERAGGRVRRTNQGNSQSPTHSQLVRDPSCGQDGSLGASIDIKDWRLPPLSIAKPGLGTKKKGCPQRVLKLMMVQCTPQENRDAMLAQTWMKSLPPEAASRQLSVISQMVERYGPIFEPRVLLCPRCLGVKYGNHPENSRQSWRRRNGKGEEPRNCDQ